MSITKNLNHLYRNISNDIVVVAVSKTKPNEDLLEAYNSGHKSFGENKVQELIEKHNALPKDIEWHFIGHLQRNKVKSIIKFIHLIHSVDSYKLLNEINKRAENENRVVDCLIQVKIATEENKYGFNFEEIDDVINFSKNLNHINVKGFMGMSTLTNDNNIINNEFSKLQNIFKNYKSKTLNILSMGMSNDYNLAIENGSNMIRLGSIIFGKRN
jgi:pyridoxal phosphate enzyme (YggS family)